MAPRASDPGIVPAAPKGVTKVIDTAGVVGAQTLVAAFHDEQDGHKAVRALERAGMPPDRIGIVVANVRQAREVAGSYSPQGALAGAMLGALLVVSYLVFGGEAIRGNPAGIALGGLAVVVAFAAIGWLAGRARIFKEDEFAEFENESAAGETIVSVLCDTPEGADEARAILERSGGHDVRLEDTSEAV